MNKSWASHEQVINKLLASYEYVEPPESEQAMNKTWTCHEQVMDNQVMKKK